MMKTAQEKEATVAFVAAGSPDVWFHFKHGGREGRPSKLMRHVQHVLVRVCLIVPPSQRNISTCMSYECVLENVLAAVLLSCD